MSGRVNGHAGLRVGVLGFGKMGALHAASVAALPDAALVAVCDTDAAALERARTRYGVTAVPDLDEFLALPLDAVIIASNTPLHAEHIRACARARRPAYAEKPVALTLDQTDDVLAEVVATGTPFQIGFQRRWDPRYRAARAVIESGDIGDPVLLKAHGRDPDASNPANWGLDRNGGLFLNCAIHDFDAARHLMGREVREVAATGATVVHHGLRDAGDIDTCSTSLFLDGDAMALTEWSRYAAYGYDVAFEVVGTRGAVGFGSTGSGGGRDGGVVVRRRTDASPTFLDVFGEAFRASIAGFLAAVRDGVAPTPGVEDARAALHVALCARSSFDASGLVVPVAALDPLGTAPGRPRSEVLG